MTGRLIDGRERDEAGILATISPEYRSWLESQQYDVTEEWFKWRLMNLILNGCA